MNSQFEATGTTMLPSTATTNAGVIGSSTADAQVAPFEFRSLSLTPGRLYPEELRWQKGSDYGGCEDTVTLQGWDQVASTAADEMSQEARDKAYREGEKEGRRAQMREMQEHFNSELSSGRKKLLDALNSFGKARNRYFRDIECEVVKLALSIATRILHRESTLDPLVLSGAVRVALEKMSDRSEVVLRVPTGDVQAWESLFQGEEALARPTVVDDPQLDAGACVLMSKVGMVELGVSVQLEEIEQGFFDLLNHRPAE